MKSQNQATKVKLNKQNQRSAGPTVVAEPAGNLAALFELPTGPVAAAGNGSVEAQANWLGKGRLQGAQRRALAAQIGRVQGNQHLQRVVASLSRDEGTASPTPARQQVPGSQALQRPLRSGAIQPKLTINPLDDVYERKADRVAEQVMCMPEPSIQLTPT